LDELISVIVPVYKVEDYLCQCIDSILMQTYSTFELILINDGSPDRCGDICDAYAASDIRIKVIHQENRGLSAARNVGIKICRGEYLTFIDSDDYVNKYYLENLYRAAKSSKSDLVVCQYRKVKGEQIFSGEKETGTVTVLGKQDFLETMLKGKAFNIHAWGKLYKTTLFSQLCYPEGKLFEDMGLTYKVVEQCQQSAYLQAELYYYRMREGSIMNPEQFHKEMMDAVFFGREMLAFIQQNYPAIYEIMQYRFFETNRCTLRCARKAKGFWKEKRLLLANIAEVKSVIYKRKNVNFKTVILVEVACIITWIVRNIEYLVGGRFFWEKK